MFVGAFDGYALFGVDATVDIVVGLFALPGAPSATYDVFRLQSWSLMCGEGLVAPHEGAGLKVQSDDCVAEDREAHS